MRTKPPIYIVKHYGQGAHLILNKQVLKDFNEFKAKNELCYCSFHTEFIDERECKVVWSTTKKFNETNFDKTIELISRDFEEFTNDNSNEYCLITKTTCQDKTTVAEFSIIRFYTI